MYKYCRIIMILIACMICLGALTKMAWATKQRVIGVIVYENKTSSNRRAQEAFVANAAKMGWKTIVVDAGTAFDKIRATFDDFIAKKVDGIFNALVDPQMIQKALEKAQAAGIPVVGGDTGYDPKLVTNLASNNYMIGGRITSYLFDSMRKKGKTQLVATVFPYHFAVRIRHEMLKTVLLDYPEITLIEEYMPKVPGTVEDAEAWMTKFLKKHPDFEGGVWNPWDAPAEGVVAAIDKQGRKNIYVTGVDLSEWSVERLQKKIPDDAFIGTEAQNYELMGAIAVDIMKKIFDGTKKASDFPSVIYIPTILVTPSNIPEKGRPWTSSGEYKPGYESLMPWPRY